MADNPTKSILLVKKSDAKKGSLWNEFANRRIIKQHGGFDIPEGDLHAIPKIQSPTDPKSVSSEETHEVLSNIEKKIQQLKKQDPQQTLPPQQSTEYVDPNESEEIQNYRDYEDEQS